MGNERYDLAEDSDAMVFEFTSVGPKGRIPKLVVYSNTYIEGMYNLGFGDKNTLTGAIDDMIVTDNKDSQKVLATVASTVYAFFNKHPDAFITARGSTKVRTRLYQMGISNNLEEIAKDFAVWGSKEAEDIWRPFEKNIKYDDFLIALKKSQTWKK